MLTSPLTRFRRRRARTRLSAALVVLVVLQSAAAVPLAHARSPQPAEPHAAAAVTIPADVADTSPAHRAAPSFVSAPAPEGGEMPPCERSGPCDDGLMRCSAGTCASVQFVSRPMDAASAREFAASDIAASTNFLLNFVSPIPAPPPKI